MRHEIEIFCDTCGNEISVDDMRADRVEIRQKERDGVTIGPQYVVCQDCKIEEFRIKKVEKLIEIRREKEKSEKLA